MSAFGEAAVRAAHFACGGKMLPKHAWRQATQKLTPSMRQKSCPKCAFLGLCEDGLVEGIDPGVYTSSIDNKEYAVHSVRLLTANPALANEKHKLWQNVGKGKKHNSQMDVVVALWNAGSICRSGSGFRDISEIHP